MLAGPHLLYGEPAKRLVQGQSWGSDLKYAKALNCVGDSRGLCEAGSVHPQDLGQSRHSAGLLVQGEESVNEIIGNAGRLLAVAQTDTNLFRPQTAPWEGSSFHFTEEGTEAWRGHVTW